MSPSFHLPTITAEQMRYDITRSYDWNYDHAPPLPRSFANTPDVDSWRLCGVAVKSPIGIAAGPLLNGRWVLHYASLGFDVLTYKTVRSRDWPCYGLPNLQPTEDVVLAASPSEPIATAREMCGSWAVSFGMPSKSPDLWRFDVEETRRLLPAEKKLSVSVVATPQPDWSIDEVANDYAQCARWAVESGADFIEINLSCPNVATCDGQLFQDAAKTKLVCERVRQDIGTTPLLLKIGQVREPEAAEGLVDAVSDSASALVMINCIAATVRDGGALLFGGERRGIAGTAIRNAVLDQVNLFSQAVKSRNAELEIVAVGGLQDKIDVGRCLERGAAAVQVATATMT